MIDASFLNKVQDLCTSKLHEVGGKTYSAATLKPVLPPEPDGICLSTIGSFCDEVMRLKNIFRGVISVASPTEIKYIAEHDANGRRPVLVTAKTSFSDFEFERFMGMERFVIRLLSQFQENEDQRQLVSLLSNVVAEETMQMQDDGVSMSVTRKSGIAKREHTTLHPFHKLCPYRSFAEIQQPESMFLLRLKQDGESVSAALFETDGGRWKLDAVSRIADLINQQVEGVPVIY